MCCARSSKLGEGVFFLTVSDEGTSSDFALRLVITNRGSVGNCSCMENIFHSFLSLVCVEKDTG